MEYASRNDRIDFATSTLKRNHADTYSLQSFDVEEESKGVLLASHERQE